jgi:dCMP deaminase
MNKWRDRFLEMTTLIGSWSKDDSTKVGAVITDAKNRVISIGFNGFPHGVKDGETDRSERLRRTCHAEVNAILFAKQDLDGYSLYVSHPPCSQCTAKLIQAGIKTVHYYEGRHDFIERWKEDLDSSEAMMTEAGVQFFKVARP